MLRTNFNSSTLVRLLAQATGTAAGAGAPRQNVAERLSQWLNAFDAIALHGIHQSAVGPATTPAGGTAQAAGRQAQLFAEAFEHTRTALVALITVQERKPVPSPGGSRRRAQGTAAMPLAPEAATDFSVYFKRHLELQREMAQKIAPLRAQARQVLVRCAPRLRPLAALDAQLEQTLGSREHKLLAQVPAMLEKRFEQLRDTPGAVPVVFAREWEAIVRAELYLRLSPVVGMMEAWGTSLQPKNGS